MSRALACLVSAVLLAGCSPFPPGDELDAGAARVADELFGHDFEAVRDRLSETAKHLFGEDRLRADVERTTRRLGPLVAKGDPVRARVEAFMVVSVPLTFQNGGKQLRITYNTEGQIESLYILDPDVPVG